MNALPGDVDAGKGENALGPAEPFGVVPPQVVGAMAFVVAVTITVVIAVAEPQLLLTVYEIAVAPPAMPRTPPLVFTLATDVEKLLQVPEPVALLRVTVLPTATVVVPEIAATVGEPITATEAVDAFTPPQLLAAVKV